MASQPHQSAPYKFSTEEIRVLQQCNKESFYQRCVPFGTLFGVGTYWAVKTGRLRPNGKFGAIPKVAAALLLGYFTGKVSYQAKCAEKLMSLPDSKIGQMLRNRRAGIADSPFTLGIPNEEQVIQNLPASEKYEDHRSTHMDLDFDRPNISGLDDNFRPRIDDFPIPPPATKNGSPPPSASYDDLRRKNREEFEMKRTKPYRGVITPEEVPSALRQHDDSFAQRRADSEPDLWSQPRRTTPSKPVNAYGDIFEK